MRRPHGPAAVCDACGGELTGLVGTWIQWRFDPHSDAVCEIQLVHDRRAAKFCTYTEQGLESEHDGRRAADLAGHDPTARDRLRGLARLAGASVSQVLARVERLSRREAKASASRVTAVTPPTHASGKATP